MIRRFNTRRAATGGAVLAALALGLGACSSGGGTATDGTAESGGEEAPSGEVVEITYMHRLPDGEGMTKVSEIVDQWNAENPDVKVTSVKFDGAAHEMIKKLETDINANSGPCLAQLGYAEVPELFVKGLTEDVTEYAKEYESNYSGAFNMMKVGETIVGLPQDTGPLVYYYNKAAFEELGIDIPTNLADFEATAATAAAAGKYIGAFQPDEAQYWLSAQSAAAGGSWYNIENDAWVVDANSDASKVVADFWQKMLDDKSVMVLERWGDAFGKALTDQELIGHIGAAWEAPLLIDTMAGTENAGNWAVAQIPDFGAGALTGPDGGSGVAVMKGCAYPEQAMAFNNYLNTQIDALVSQGLVVAAKGTMTTPEYIAEFYGGQDVFAELTKANANLSDKFAYMPFFSAVGPAMTEAAAAAGSGSGTVADIFVAAQDASVKALKDGNLPVAE
ncbi:ABC transporter substrate-binding protein [Actinomyces minihominis]|uniref:ABC transporter substrate-binding protein n=1 Tax=Actinomyces minihominis TaxID=2002838 RepID=UPI000C072C9A|nr:extracellular solute-binding protein [Actinomyces minihominis]